MKTFILRSLQISFLMLITILVKAQYQKPLTIPMNNDFNLVFIKVSINGTDSLNFIFDTGWDDNVLDESIAKQLGYDVSERYEFPQPGGVVEFGRVDSANLSIKGVQLKPENFWTTDLSQFEMIIEQPMHGILGYEFMRKYLIGLDYEQSQFIIYPENTEITKEYSAIDVLAIKKEPFIFGHVANAKGKKVKAKLKMDTGSADFIGFNNNYAENNELIDSTTARRIKKGVGGGGTTQGYEYRLSDFKLAGFSLKNMVVGVTTDSHGFENRDDAGTVGGEYLHRFNWILDFKNDKAYLKSNRNYSTPSPIDRSGLWVIQNPEKERMILEVVEGSPAAEVNLEEGMLIETIEGRDAKEFSLFQIRKMLQNPERKEISLKIKDKGEVIIILENQI